MATEDKLWRAVIRVERADENYVYLVVPGHSPTTVLQYPREKLPKELRDKKAPFHCFAKTNLGAERSEDLRFYEWESVMKHTAETYQKLTGHAPKNDDLDRINCEEVGTPGHMACGVCLQCGQPAWTCEHFGETVNSRMEANRERGN